MIYEDGRLMGHIYAAPYGVLEPELAWVIEDAAGVCGFVAGTADTRRWEEPLERQWWPELRRAYRDPSDRPRAQWTADERRAFMFHHPERTPDSVVSGFPALLYLNLLPRLQGRGLSRRLLQA